MVLVILKIKDLKLSAPSHIAKLQQPKDQTFIRHLSTNVGQVLFTVTTTLHEETCLCRVFSKGFQGACVRECVAMLFDIVFRCYGKFKKIIKFLDSGAVDVQSTEF